MSVEEASKGNDRCPLCGADVSRFGIYRYGIHVGKICYDCDQSLREAKREKIKRVRKRSKPSEKKESMTKKIKSLYRSGVKASEISKQFGIPTEEVYRRLNL